MKCGILVTTCIFIVIAGCETIDGTTTGDGASGAYDPAAGLQLTSDGLTLTVPPGAIADTPTLSARKAGAGDLPAALPGGVGFAGGVFGPDGQVFQVPAEVALQLPAATIATMLPVVTFDTTLNRWVGTGANAVVAAGGLDVTFELEHFSIGGVPSSVPIPDPGDEIGSFLVVSNNGMFESDAISSNSAAMLFSDFGDTFSISVSSQEVNMQGMVETKALGLSAVLVTRVENYIVGAVGGGASLYNDGMLNEPAVGVMIMSRSGSTVNLSAYVATPERVIAGTLTGPGA